MALPGLPHGDDKGDYPVDKPSTWVCQPDNRHFKEDMEYAMKLWLEKSSMSEFSVTGVTLHPGNKYVARITVAPPHTPPTKDTA